MNKQSDKTREKIQTNNMGCQKCQGGRRGRGPNARSRFVFVSVTYSFEIPREPYRCGASVREKVTKKSRALKFECSISMCYVFLINWLATQASVRCLLSGPRENVARAAHAGIMFLDYNEFLINEYLILSGHRKEQRRRRR